MTYVSCQPVAAADHRHTHTHPGVSRKGLPWLVGERLEAGWQFELEDRMLALVEDFVRIRPCNRERLPIIVKTAGKQRTYRGHAMAAICRQAGWLHCRYRTQRWDNRKPYDTSHNRSSSSKDMRRDLEGSLRLETVYLEDEHDRVRQHVQLKY